MLSFAPSAGWTPLMYAAYVSHDTVVNLLLEAKADPNKGTPGGLTPLMVAAGCGNESICYFLIQVDILLLPHPGRYTVHCPVVYSMSP